MENIMKSYLEQRFRQIELQGKCGPGPIVTLSREFGCPSKLIGQMLTDALNKRFIDKKTKRWRFINKEVVEEASRELGMNPVQVSHLFSSAEKGLMKDILTSFSDNYISSHKIRKTIDTVIRGFAQQGNIVMVGRGSVAILQDCPNAFHIRLQAPFEWRIKNISFSKGLTESDARKLTVEIDNKRIALIEVLTGKKFEHTLFDVAFNCSNLTTEQIVISIIRIMEVKGMI